MRHPWLATLIGLVTACDVESGTPDVVDSGTCEPSGERVTLIARSLRFARSADGVSDGFDLDGFATSAGDDEGCGVPDLTSPDGTSGVDNAVAGLLPILDLTEAALERPGTVAAALEATRGQTYDEWQSRYRSISAPTLLLWGRDDEVTTLAFGERLARELPNARLAVYPRCGHFPMIEAIGASNRDLAAFLAEAP